MKKLVLLLSVMSFQVLSYEMARGPSSFLLEKNKSEKISKMNCYGNCGDTCYVLTKYQSKNQFSSKEKSLMKSEAQSLCELKTAEVNCLAQDSENDILHSEMCTNRFEEVDEAMSASINFDQMMKMAE